VRVGVVMLPTDPWPETVTRARHLEALGYDHLWTYDHLSWRRYRGRSWFGAIPWLTGLAGATSRIRLGTMVASPNLRHPVTLAQDAVTLDHVSNGRLTLGVGAGGVGFDSAVFGADALSPRALVDRLDEFVALLRDLFDDDTVSYRGTYYTVKDACVQPNAIQRPRIPIAIAAGGSRALAVAARHADAWITFGDTTNVDRSARGTELIVRAQSQELDVACATIGRDPGQIQRIYMIGNTEERPLASVGAFEEFAARYADIGFTDLVFHHPRPDDPAWDEPASIVGEIAREVLPRLRN